MDKDSSELVEYLGQKFDKIDQRFDIVDKKFDKVDQNFEKMNLQLIGVNSRLGSLEENKADKSDINNLLTAIDSYAKKADAYFQEMLMLAHKVDKLEKWIHQIAEKVGIKLQY